MKRMKGGKEEPPKDTGVADDAARAAGSDSAVGDAVVPEGLGESGGTVAASGASGLETGEAEVREPKTGGISEPKTGGISEPKTGSISEPKTGSMSEPKTAEAEVKQNVESKGSAVTDGNTNSDAKQLSEESPEQGNGEEAVRANGAGEDAVADAQVRTDPEGGATQNSTSSGSSDEQQQLVDSLKAEVAENYDKYLRAVAELENYKKRVLRERSDLLRYAGENLARDVLEVADNLERALAADSSAQEDFAKGIKLTYDRLIAILEQHGIKGEKGLGTNFDPVKHEALVSVPTEDQPPGTVLDEFKRAYFFKDKLLRPAQVVVAAAPPSAAEPAGDGTSGDGEGGDSES